MFYFILFFRELVDEDIGRIKVIYRSPQSNMNPVLESMNLIGSCFIRSLLSQFWHRGGELVRARSIDPGDMGTNPGHCYDI